MKTNDAFWVMKFLILNVLSLYFARVMARGSVWPSGLLNVLSF